MKARQLLLRVGGRVLVLFPGSIVESLMNTSITEGQSISRPPYFDGTNYFDWKERMTIFIQSVDFKLWLVIKNGPNIPTKRMEGRYFEKSEDEFNDEDMKNMELEAKAKNILYCALNPDSFKQISQCKTAKEIWDKLGREMAIVAAAAYSTTAIPPRKPAEPPAEPDYNYPNRDFLDETREAMNNFLNWCVPLHKHALEGNWAAAKRILDQDDRLRHAAIAKGYPTVLHIAAGANHVHFVKELLPLLDEEHIGLQDIKGNTAFCFAAAGGNIEMVDLLLQANPHLPNIRGGEGCTPVQFAALQGNCETAWFLFERTSKDEFLDEDWQVLFFTCITTGNYHLALKLATLKEDLAFARDDNNETALHLLAQIQKPLDSCFHCPQQLNPIKINPCLKQHVAFQLVKFLWNTILRKKHVKSEIHKIIRKPSHVLFDAAKVGNFGFLSELISLYPGLIWEVDKRDHSVIHTAVLYRHASIYNLIHEIGPPKDVIVQYISEDDNTLLHLAAKLAPQSQLQLISGAPFQMCQELHWFEEVKKIMPPSFIRLRNSEGLTAQELFTKEHEGLRGKAETWMKDTAGSCMLISTVIATGVLAGAINIPGSVGNLGKPNYLGKTAFLVFTISDATAFISSATSILIFLSIIISRYAEYDFYKSLPLKLIAGLVTLFVSITGMMVAFGSAFFITYYYGSEWTPGFISAFAFLPILLFVGLQFSLWLDIIRSTYHTRYLFKQRKNMIYVPENYIIDTNSESY